MHDTSWTAGIMPTQGHCPRNIAPAPYPRFRWTGKATFYRDITIGALAGIDSLGDIGRTRVLRRAALTVGY